ncbi:MAG: hypothetical protein K9J80_17255 [Sulfuritalea sp.]|nr:hypothetical protein [Sulfuritalea sp.]
MNSKKLTQLMTQIAQQHLRLETLETRHSDGLDFHDIAVWQIESALRAAFEAGREEGLKSQPTA